MAMKRRVQDPGEILYCGNSGTTARLMIGAVASNPINCTFTEINP